MHAVSEFPSLPSVRGVVGAALRREWLSHRLNRFLYSHVVLVLVVGALPMLTPGDGFSRGAAWWLLHGVLYAVSLSSLLLGLSSAHAETEEYVWIMGQPAGIVPWLAGKAVGLVLLTGGSTALLALPTLVLGGASRELAVVTGGAMGVAAVCALAGFALGFWIRDGVRGLIAALAVWFAMLFGVDLLLLAVAGAPWVQANPDVWIALLMANPLDAFRITVLFSVERAAFGSLNAGALTNWWAANAVMWLGLLCLLWVTIGGVLAWLGLRRRTDDL
jgi:hypothetical protein